MVKDRKIYLTGDKYDKEIQNCIIELAQTGVETVEVLEKIYDSLVNAYTKKRKYTDYEIDFLKTLKKDIKILKLAFLTISF